LAAFSVHVLVVDDSAFSRRAITRMLGRSPLVKAVDVARNGEEALQKTFELEPDVITLDLEMPRMDGFTFLRLVMANRPTPVLVISGRACEADVFRALELGAVDFISKPTQRADLQLATIERELIRKLHAIHELRIEKVRERLQAAPTVLPGGPAGAPPAVVAIGASTGGPAALLQILGAFSEPPPCSFLVAQHMPEGFTRGFADRLDRLTSLRAREAQDGEMLEPGCVLVAPGGRHLELESVGGTVVTRLAARLPSERYAPSIDRLFASAAKHFGSYLMAVVLTGMGDDGRCGVGAVKVAGGCTVAESEETAVIFGMPRRAIGTGDVDRVLPLPEIARSIQMGGRWNAPVEGQAASHGSSR